MSEVFTIVTWPALFPSEPEDIDDVSFAVEDVVWPPPWMVEVTKIVVWLILRSPELDVGEDFSLSPLPDLRMRQMIWIDYF